MAITPTTLAAVIDGMTTTIQNLAPDVMARHLFKRVGRLHDLRTWSESTPGEAILRKFEIVRPEGPSGPGVIDPTASLFRRDLEILIAYPARPTGLYGDERIEDLEDVIDSDGHQIWTKLYESSSLVAGAGAYIPTVGATDRGEDVWFLPITVEVQWYQATDFVP